MLDGWPALQVPGDDGPIPLPIVRQPASLSGRRRPRRGYVDLALDGHLEAGPEERARLGELLTADPASGLPYYRRDFWPWWTGRLPAAAGRNRGAVVRAVLLTTRADLDDGSLDRPLSRDCLWDSGADQSDAFKQRARGRRVLHALGAWPWALQLDGKLPKGWTGPQAVERFEQPGDEYVEALRSWAQPLIARRAREVVRAQALYEAFRSTT